MKLLLKILCLLCLALGVSNALSTSEFYSYVGSDFTQDYVAGTNLRLGLPIYGEAITENAKARHGFNGIENFHPPFLALPYAVLAFLTFNTAHVVLGLLSVLSLVGAVVLVLRAFNRPLIQSLYFLPLLLFWHPFYETVALGQSTVILACIICVAWYLGRRGKQRAFGIFVGIAAMIKLFPAFLGFLSLRRGEWHAAAAAVLTFSFGVVVTGFAVGWDQIWFYIAEIMPKDAEVWGVNLSNMSLHGFIVPLFSKTLWSRPAMDAPIIGAFLLWMVIGIVVFFVMKACKKGKAAELENDKLQSYDEQFSLFLVSAFLLSPVCWTHNLILFLPVYGLFIFQSRSRSELKIFIVAFMLLSLPSYALVRTLQDFVGHPHLYGIYLVIAKAQLWGVLLLWGLLISRCLQKKATR